MTIRANGPKQRCHPQLAVTVHSCQDDGTRRSVTVAIGKSRSSKRGGTMARCCRKFLRSLLSKHYHSPDNPRAVMSFSFAFLLVCVTMCTIMSLCTLLN